MIELGDLRCRHCGRPSTDCACRLFHGATAVRPGQCPVCTASSSPKADPVASIPDPIDSAQLSEDETLRAIPYAVSYLNALLDQAWGHRIETKIEVMPPSRIDATGRPNAPKLTVWTRKWM